MSDDAKEAAQKAEEALKKVQEAKAALEKAEIAAAEAKAEAKVAGKKSPTITFADPEVKFEERKEGEPEITGDVVKVEAVPGVTKSMVLDFLQKRAFDLRKTVRGLMDIRFEDDPPRVVFDVVSSEVKIPQLDYNGFTLPTEMVVKAVTGTGTTISVNDNDPEKDEVYQRSIDGAGAKALGITEALGPQSMAAAKKREALEAFWKRHPAVKVPK
jgi:hypothetical protein